MVEPSRLTFTLGCPPIIELYFLYPLSAYNQKFVDLFMLLTVDPIILLTVDPFVLLTVDPFMLLTINLFMLLTIDQNLAPACIELP